MRTQVAVWALADDPDAYGEQAGWFMLTSPDGETEMEGGPWPTDEAAIDYAAEMGWEVVPSTIHHAPNYNRPGEMAAIYAAETGVSYSEALVACNMD